MHRRTLADVKNPHLPGISSGDQISRKLNVVPFERKKQLPLRETVTPEHRASDLILKRSNQLLLLSLVSEFRQREKLSAHRLRPRFRLPFLWSPGMRKSALRGGIRT